MQAEDQVTICTGTCSDGRPCTRSTALRVTSLGPRCLWHDPDRPPVPRPPRQGFRVGRLKTPADAARLAARVTKGVLQGELTTQQAHAAKSLLAEFRASLAAADVLAQFETLKAQVRELRAAKAAGPLP